MQIMSIYRARAKQDQINLSNERLFQKIQAALTSDRNLIHDPKGPKSLNALLKKKQSFNISKENQHLVRKMLKVKSDYTLDPVEAQQRKYMVDLRTK